MQKVRETDSSKYKLENIGKIRRCKLFFRNRKVQKFKNGNVIFRHNYRDQKGKGRFGQSKYQKLYRQQLKGVI